ncbi:MAG TPA: hypothetical protein HA360_03610 [Nanoarchaeota archaeon]|nr:hypothetical protein [Candidatus Woesearchaeota archaeon]HIH15621.1 hypothetical protein [Nanoarchaeota archaeon]HIH59531.1 hypothetical protein [Nanoarchaeota archaeon]HII14134.1 hypothetical protein [Nanoarchaeota archaeon]HIJ05212.1 hypothetical protein [Nanoarchaeota archaeon]
MNKKAFVFLYICTISFIIAIFVFYGSVGKQTPGGESLALGEKEIQVFSTYQEAEQQIYSIELAALLSAKEASQDNFERSFEEKFAEYLKKYSLGIEEYDFTYTTKEGTMNILGKAQKSLIFKKEFYTYSIAPDFFISIPYDTNESSEMIFK